MVKTRSLYLTWPWIRTGSWRTDRQTDGQNSHSQYALSAVPAGTAVARKKPQHTHHAHIRSTSQALSW